MPENNPPHAWYALRRTLPTWSFEENLAELIQVLPRYRIDELIVKVDTEEFTHGQPPLQWIRNYQPRLHRLRREMEQLGIRYSLNPWITLGHNDRGRDATRQLSGLRPMVGHDGTRCTCCACPLCEVWRAHVEAVWTLYAATAPSVIWIEDDIRTFNHSPVRYGCFCTEHLRRFSERVGAAVDREELVAAILQPGTPHPWRSEWLDLQAAIMVETAGFLARVVHRTAPDTRIGLMSSGPRTHCLEGRQWDRFAAALADGQMLYSRPPLGNYSEGSLRGLYYSHDSIKITRHCLPAGTIEQTEVENVPFTRYSKSTRFTFLQLAVSFAYGSHGVTMNLYDHCGTPMEDEPHYGRMLAERKPFLEALASRAQQSGPFRGVSLLFDQQASYHRHLPPGADYGTLVADGATVMQLLETHGLPTTYDAEPVAAATGQQLRACTDAEITTLLDGGLLLDGTAAAVLHERGFGAQIGLQAINPAVHLDTLGAFAAEEFFNPDFGGRPGAFMTLTLPDLGGRPSLCVAELQPGARPISRIVDPDAQPSHVAMYAFENDRGGRVAVHLLDLDSAFGTAFNHPFRNTQLHHVVDWLWRGRTPLRVTGDGVYPLAFRRDGDRHSLLGLFNLSLDSWPDVEMHLSDSRQLDHVEQLDVAGRWGPCQQLLVTTADDRHVLRIGTPVAFDQPLFITVNWA